MGTPYVSTRTGSGQWIMQRVSALLLIGLAFGHFGLQHFTTDAVSTGLTVAARFNSPYWQGYYVLFIALALYHGINGVVGILRDYNPRPLPRVLCEVALWTLAAFWGGRGIINVVTPRPLGEVKEFYAVNGLPLGETRGSPPGISGVKRYDFGAEERELPMLLHYLAHHVGRSEKAPLPAAGVPVAASAAVRGKVFDEWALARVSEGPTPPERRDREEIFSSTYEFAVWALRVREADALRRKRAGDTAATDVLGRIGGANVPSYRANDLH